MNVTYLEASEDLVVVGPAIRTSFDGAAEDIGAFWARFMSEGWLERLSPDGARDALYAVYCDYESDFRGAYTMLLGVAASASMATPPGARRVTIPRGRRARFAFAGDPRRVVGQSWSFINGDWERQVERSYSADFERYPLAALRLDYAEGEIVVSLR